MLPVQVEAVRSKGEEAKAEDGDVERSKLRSHSIRFGTKTNSVKDGAGNTLAPSASGRGRRSRRSSSTASDLNF